MSDSVRWASSLASCLMGEDDGFPPNLKSLFSSLSEGRDTTELDFRCIRGAMTLRKSSSKAACESVPGKRDGSTTSTHGLWI